MADYSQQFSKDVLDDIFPASRADAFFDALFGDAEEGSYDIELGFSKADGNDLFFEFRLRQRPGKCLACNLTYGLPQVFSRHPIINVEGVAKDISSRIGGNGNTTWKLGVTEERSHELHVIPLQVTLG